MVLSICVLSAALLASSSEKDLVDFVGKANQSAIDSIQSMSCSYQRVPWKDVDGAVKPKTGGPAFLYRHWWLDSPGKFWRLGEGYRLLETHQPGVMVDRLCHGYNQGKSLILNHGEEGRMKPILAWCPLVPADGEGGSLWGWLLFNHWGRVQASRYTFRSLLLQPHKIKKNKRLPNGDIYVSLTHELGGLEFWFDPKVNYLVRKTIIIPIEEPDIVWENEVIHFTEGSKGVFVPDTIEHRCAVKGKPDGALRTILESLKVNQPMSKLRIPGIAGMSCYDMVREVKYTVDADGQQVGPATNYNVGRTKPERDQPKSTRIQEWSPRREVDIWKVVLSISLALLVAALVLKINVLKKAAKE